MVARGEGIGGLGKKREGTEKYRLVVTEQSRGCRSAAQGIQSIISNDYLWRQVGTGNSGGITL